MGIWRLVIVSVASWAAAMAAVWAFDRVKAHRRLFHRVEGEEPDPLQDSAYRSKKIAEYAWKFGYASVGVTCVISAIYLAHAVIKNGGW